MSVRPRITSSVPLRYGIAAVLATVALLLQFGLDALLGPGQDPGTYQFFLAAVALSAILCGRSAGFLALALTVLFRLIYFYPLLTWENPSVAVRNVLFVSLGVLIVHLGGKLFESEERFSTALTSIGDAVITTDEHRMIRFMNPVAELLSGWSAEHANGRNIEEVLQLIDGRTNGKVDVPIAVVLESGTTARLQEDTVLVSRSGGVVAIEDSASPILGGSRQPMGAVMVFRDVSERRLAQKALQESEQRYRFLSDAVPNFIFSANSKGECDYFNRRWLDYTGLTLEQSRGYSWISALHPDDVSPVLSRWTASVETGEPFHVECRLADHAGSYRTFLMRGLPMPEDGDHTRRLFGVCTDVEDFKRTEKQLHQAQKMEAIGRLAGGVAHDFNNLLTVITGYGYMLKDQAAAGSLPWTQADQICRAADQASGLTRQLLSFSRGQIVQPTVLDLNQVVQQTKQLLARVIGEDIEIVTSLDPELSKTLADRGQIVQILMNLSVNSRDAMPGGGRLVIETSNVALDESYTSTHVGVSPGQYVLLAVSDTGEGMNSDTQARAFEPFFTTKEAGKGTGLGLSTVYGIVQQSAGHVWLYSEVGSGTTVKIYLPAVHEEQQSEIVQDQPDTSLQGTETILVVEDQPALLQFVESAAGLHGYRVLGYSDPAEALKACREFAEGIDLLLTDVVMPGMSGSRLAEEVTQVRPGIKVLYMSGYSGEVAIPHGGAPGLNFVQKPFTTDALLRAIRSALEGRAGGHETASKSG